MEAMGAGRATSSSPPSTVPGSHSWSLMLASLMAVWATGGAVFLLLLATTDPDPAVEHALHQMTLIGFTVLAILLVGRTHLPAWTPDVSAVILYTMVSWLVILHGDPTSPYSFAYLWLAVHAFYFLHWKRAAPQLAYIGGAYALALSSVTPHFPLLRWATTMVTAVLICAMVALLRSDLHVLVERLAGLATTDVLTGLRNRRGYDEAVEIELARADRSGRPLTVLMGDLDHFKAVNDRLGHAAGDEVLRRVAQVLGGRARRVDVAIRLGGEEFVLLLPDTDAGGGHLVAERMRHELRREFREHPVPVSMSFGVACYPDDAGDADELLKAADTALMAAKRAGRDRTVVYSPALGLPR